MATENINVGNFAAKFRGGLGAFKRGVMLKLFSAVIFDTPVDTGRLRANWKFSRNAEPTPDAQLNLFDKAGNSTVAKIQQRIQGEVTFQDDIVSISNSLPYANRIEYEGWSRIKAPQGMVRRNMTRIAAILRAQASGQSFTTTSTLAAAQTKSTAMGYVAKKAPKK